MTNRGQARRFHARRSTWAGLGGIALMALGFVLTWLDVGGKLFPTVLAVIGFVLLNAGIGMGVTLVLENARFRRGQSYYDPDEEDDE